MRRPPLPGFNRGRDILRAVDRDPRIHVVRNQQQRSGGVGRVIVSRRVIVRIFLGALVCATAFGDSRDRGLFQFQHTTWIGREGVPNRISALAQTSDGYLWLGTASGLYRFDGVQFERYELPAGDRSRSDHVYSLQATSDGGLWIAFRWGGAAFLKDGRITNYGEAEGLN